MPILIDWDRPKLTSTVDSDFNLSATISESGNGFDVDLTIPITQDTDAQTITRTLRRFKIIPVVTGNSLTLNTQELTFPGTVTTNPLDSVASTTGSISKGTVKQDIDNFFVEADNARTNA